MTETDLSEEAKTELLADKEKAFRKMLPA